jgi:magnesium transporter
MDTDQIIIEKFLQTHTLEAVRIIEKLDYVEISAFLNDIPPDLAAKVIAQMNSYRASKCLELLDIHFAVEVLKGIDFLELESLIRQSDEGFRNTALEKLPPELSGKIRQKLKYAANSIGSLMNLKVFYLKQDITVKGTKEIIKKEKSLTLSEIYVTDMKGRLTGLIKVHDLIRANGAEQISSIMIKEIPKFFADEPVQQVLNHLVWAEYKAIPVVDNTGMLIGSLHFEDIKKASLKTDQEFNKQIIETGTALGELYLIGLTALLQSTGKLE